jgi:hypothetical protein
MRLVLPPPDTAASPPRGRGRPARAGGVFAVTTAIAAVLAPVSRRRRVLRLAAFALNYCVVELAVMVAAGLLWLRHVVPGRRGAEWERSWVNANQDLLAWALGRVLGAARRFSGL